MTSVAHTGTQYRCYDLLNGYGRLYHGCYHRTPKEAIAHSDELEAASRREQHPDGTDPLTGEPDRGAEASAALAEASDPAGSLPVPLRG
jgi:hypothetical protein